MHQMVSANLETSRRWWVLAIVVSAQFMFGVDAFVVNVALPTIAVELRASSAQIESVIAVYLIAYATLVVTGGRLGDIYGTKTVFLAGVLGFTEVRGLSITVNVYDVYADQKTFDRLQALAHRFIVDILTDNNDLTRALPPAPPRFRLAGSDPP